MKIYLKILIVLNLWLFVGCNGNHLINNKEYLAIIDKSFTEREHLAKNRKEKIFSVFNKKLTTDQRDALKFLYAFMPLSDLADYDGEFFLANVNMSLRVREEAA